MAAEIEVVRCGVVPYEEARELQEGIAARRRRGEIPDTLLLLEHPPVYTRGRRSQPGELPMGVEWYEAQGIEVRDTDRGGLVTYHGPGQLVAYPIVDLGRYSDDVHAYVRGLERAIIEALGEAGVEAQTIAGLTGVWVPRRAEMSAPPRRRDDLTKPAGQIGPSADGSGQSGPSARKIGSIGLHVSRRVTTHGLAVNVNNDLQPFEWIVPCGIEGVAMTSLGRELGAEQDLGAFADALAGAYGRVLGREPVAGELEDLLPSGEPARSR
ncbi:MAG TPA: lipoyl(octanoyl) transferase LipB [Solirubrobacterales bacterium]|nr:lipoyl(octanoyl) transferase LipB [Solirubrobacterales bacterium]